MTGAMSTMQGIFRSALSSETSRKTLFFGAAGAVGCLIGALLGEPLYTIINALQFRGPKVDVLFVLDATGSMQPQIDGVRRGIADFAKQLSERGLDERVGLVAFRDEKVGEKPQVLKFNGDCFTNEYAEFQRAVSDVSAAGGGDDPESSYDALRLAARQPFRKQATRVLLLITDAPPHLPDRVTQSIEEVRLELKNSGISQLHIVVNARDLQDYAPLQQMSRGEVFELGRVGTGAGGFDALLPVIGESIAEATVRGLASNTAIDRSLAPWQVAITSLWTGLLAAGVGLALVFAQNHYLHKQLFDPSRLLAGLGLGLAVGAAAGALGQLVGLLPQLAVFGPGIASGWLPVAIAFAGGLLGWALLGGLLGRGLTFFVPNLEAGPALLGGVLGGVAGALGFTLLSGLLGDTSGRLSGSAGLGFFVGIMIALVEAATRDFFLEVRYGQREVVNVSLGVSPVTVGADGRAATIFVANAPRPISLKYWIEDGQLRVLDYVTEHVVAVTAGDERKLGTTTLTIKSETLGRGGPAMQVSGTMRPPPPAPPPSIAAPRKPSPPTVQPKVIPLATASIASPNAPSVEHKLPPPPPPPPPRKG
jgi:Ca-activated chloride channel family protein